MMLSAQQYLKGRDRKFENEFTDDVRKNSARIIASTAEILSAFGHKREVLHGWTPKNIAKRDGLDLKSPHIWAQAIALKDFDKSLGHWSVTNIERLVEVGFWMQSLIETHSSDIPYVRFQIVRPPCGSRIFST